VPAQPHGLRLAPPTGSEARAANHRAVLDLLRRKDAVTRAQLCRETGLSPTTVSRLVAELAGRGLVTEEGAHRGEGAGRPAALLRLNRRAGIAVGVDAGVEHVGVVVGDLSRRVRVERWHPLLRDMRGARLAVLLRAVRDGIAGAGTDPGELVGAGISVAAPSCASGEVTDPKVLPWWEEARVAETLTSQFGIQVVQDNDANLGALAELTWGARAGTRNMVYLKPASRIGAGLVLDGAVYRGPSGFAGEIGHSVTEPGGRPCWCGGRGCLELYAGGAAILDDLAARNRPLAGIAELAAAARAGDPQVAAVLARAGRALGRALRTTAVLLSPREIVVGGERPPWARHCSGRSAPNWPRCPAIAGSASACPRWASGRRCGGHWPWSAPGRPASRPAPPAPSPHSAAPEPSGGSRGEQNSPIMTRY
jgi:predicted NBD/HSP70 family sugar kinase